jgi:hypothetical protein
MSDALKQARKKLLERLKMCSPYKDKVDEYGYMDLPEQNLIPGVSMEQIKEELKEGSGDELKKKFRAIHSSSALVVNTFAPFKDTPNNLTLFGIRGFRDIYFEKKLPTGLGGTPPNLDLFAENDQVIIGVESKFLEYLTPKIPFFPDSYKRTHLPLAEDKWWGLLEDMKKSNPLHLDAAQLIKHYLGLVNHNERNKKEYPNRKIFLVYLFWEPENWDEFDVFIKHREEIERFKDRVKDTSVTFADQSYPELWKEWEFQKELANHLMRLRGRYYVRI